MRSYIAALEPDGQGGFGVFFPDLPGLASAGDTMDEAMRNALEALCGHVAALRDDGDPVPPPRSIDAIFSQPTDDIEGCLLVAIPLLETGGAQVRVNISGSRFEIDAIDAAARRRGLTRSAFLLQAARDKIASETA